MYRCNKSPAVFFSLKKKNSVVSLSDKVVIDRHLKVVIVHKMADGRGEEGEAIQSYTPSPSLLHHSSPPHSTVQSGSDQQAGFQTLGQGYHDNCVLLQLPWLPLLSVVV